MFPIIPSNIYCTSAKDSVKNTNFLLNYERDKKSDKSDVCCDGAFAGEVLLKDTVSPDMDPSVLTLQKINKERITIINSTNGTIKPVQKSYGSNWIKNIKLSPDVLNNSLIEITANRLVRIRISKDIFQGQELVSWFSEEILAYMCIPFLTPNNILGNNCYKCHLCDFCFECPNPLKIHLALNCGNETVDTLWLRLHSALSSQLSSLRNMVYKQHSSTIEEESKIQRYSAFKPILPPNSHDYRPSLQILPQTSTNTNHQHSPNAVAAAQIETIVSNMGASKQGHLCIYCGKVYSRKYGLKIHIRTHTGFKPLKCKYCLRPFGDPSNLNKHVRLHMQTTSIYNCHICNKILARKRDLQRHMQNRHNSKPSKEKNSSSDDD